MVDKHLKSLIENDEKGVLLIYQELYPKVRNYVMANSGSEQDARDVMQKGLLQIAVRARVKDFRINSSFDGYFFVVCRNIWVRESKKRNSMVTFDNYSAPVSEEQEIARQAVEQEKWELFEEKLKTLSDNCRKLLSMFFKKIAYKEIVKELDYATENVVKQRIFKCKTRLKDAIHSDTRYKDLMI